MLKEQGWLPPSFSETTFYRLLTHFYWFVSFQKWTPFSKCDDCSRFKQLIFGSTGGDDAEAGDGGDDAEAAGAGPSNSDPRLGLRVHRQLVGLARRLFKFRVSLSKAFPRLFMSLIADGMDSAKTYAPHAVSQFIAGKGLSNQGKFMKTKLMGVLAAGKYFQGYVTYPHYAGGGSLMATVLMQTLLKHHEKYGFLPPVLFLQLDNCGRDNKNHTIQGLIGYLLQKRIFLRIYVNYLPVGRFQVHCLIVTLSRKAPAIVVRKCSRY